MTTLNTRQTLFLVVLFVVTSLAFIQLDSRRALDPVKDSMRAVVGPVVTQVGNAGRRGDVAMEREIACHRERWNAVGNAENWVPNDPTLVEGAEVDVVDRDGRVEVIVTAPTPDAAGSALARAQGRFSEQQKIEQTARR